MGVIILSSLIGALGAGVFASSASGLGGGGSGLLEFGIGVITSGGDAPADACLRCLGKYLRISVHTDSIVCEYHHSSRAYLHLLVDPAASLRL